MYNISGKSAATNGAFNKYPVYNYLGALSGLFLFVLIATGELLSIYYRPTAPDAFASVQYINQIDFGNLIRTMHHFSASGLILSVTMYLLGLFFSKRYSHWMWYTGFILFTIILLQAFTGQILPWDEVSYFGAAIGFSQFEKIPLIGSFAVQLLRGGNNISGETLSRAFTFHAIIVPLTVLFLYALHFLNFLKHLKNSPDESELNNHIFRSQFNYKMLVPMLIALAALTVFSIFFTNTFGKPFDLLNPTPAPEGIHPEWYFMWIYQTVKLDAYIPSLLITMFSVVIFMFLLFLPEIGKKYSEGRSGKILNKLVCVFITYILLMTILGYLATGINLPVLSIENNSTGGIGAFYFSAIVLFTIGILIFLINARIQSGNGGGKAKNLD